MSDSVKHCIIIERAREDVNKQMSRAIPKQWLLSWSRLQWQRTVQEHKSWVIFTGCSLLIILNDWLEPFPLLVNRWLFTRDDGGCLALVSLSRCLSLWIFSDSNRSTVDWSLLRNVETCLGLFLLSPVSLSFISTQNVIILLRLFMRDYECDLSKNVKSTINRV